MDGVWTGIIWALAPTILVGLIFWFVMRAVVHADRNERRALAKIEAEERARRGLAPRT
jgi:flagellar biosynthesis/type III secretory pathway M-ring protein FliF/YscJ